MGTVISNLKARFGVDTTDFKKGLKDGEKALDDFRGAAGSKLDEFVSMFGFDMGAVNESIGTAFKSLNFLGQSFKGAASGGEKLTIAMKVLRTALISTGIGAIAVALGSIIAYFQKTGEGADKFGKILAQIKSVINNTIERLAVFGKGLWQILTGKFKEGWETMTGAFKGMGEELREDWKAAGDLADRENALNDREIALINSLEERRAKSAELRLAAKEEGLEQEKKLDLIRQAENLVKSVYGDEISLEQERLAIMKEKLALQTKDPTREQRREIAEQEAKINELFRAQADKLREITGEKNAIIGAMARELEAQKELNEIKGIDAAGISIIKPPDNSKLVATSLHAVDQVSAVYQVLGKVAIDVAGSVNSAFESMATGMGEFLGALVTGSADFGDFGKLVAGVFADMAINVGRIAIGAGLAVLGVKEALMTLNPWVAIAAGVSLVAIGTAVKGALANAASGRSATTSLAAQPASYIYDTRGSAAAKVNVALTGTFRIEGRDLVTVIEEENTRKDIST
jgi:hypothetical protein